MSDPQSNDQLQDGLGAFMPSMRPRDLVVTWTPQSLGAYTFYEGQLGRSVIIDEYSPESFTNIDALYYITHGDAEDPVLGNMQVNYASFTLTVL